MRRLAAAFKAQASLRTPNGSVDILLPDLAGWKPDWRSRAIAENTTVIVIPTYNESENITPLLTEIHSVVPDADVLVVDDNSPDGTARIVTELGDKDARIRLLSRAGKLGLGTAYVAGFRECLKRGYTVLCQMDCDFSHQPRYLADFLREIQTYDVVLGSRYISGGGTEDWSLKRKVLSVGGNTYAGLILDRKSVV